jgi:hypothetical protein
VKNVPNGIHEPFHSILNRGCQNTDPYVYGDCFKYTTCSQTGILLKLSSNSLILFGTTKDIGFELDTVFVVKKSESAQEVSINNAINYTNIYIEETLNPLGQDYYKSKKRIYHGQTWWNKKDYFSFVPCKPDCGKGFQKAILPIPPMAKQKVGHPYHHFSKLDHFTIWKFVTIEVLKQGFSLGIRFEEPKINNEILKGFTVKQSNSNGTCNKDSCAVKIPKGCR